MAAISEGILITDATRPNDPIVYVNPGFEHITGYRQEEVLGRNPRSFIPGPLSDPAAVARIRETVESHSSASVQILGYRKDRSTYWAALSISPMRNPQGEVTHMVRVLLDITQHKLIEERLRQHQKMEAVGRLVGGIAHDFNNLLTAIMIYCGLLRDAMPPENRLRRHVEEIRAASERGAALVGQLLALTRQQVIEARILDLNNIVLGMRDILQRLIGEDIHLVTMCAEGLASAKVDPEQIHQALLNLAINARDAMPAGGKLVLETLNTQVTEDFAHSHPGLRPGNYVVLAVSDNGTGIDPEVLPHIFEPFYTTKRDQGSGLGLATVYGIVKQNQGCIYAQSEQGCGATFCIYLPAVEAEAGRAPGEQVAAISAGPQTVLLVEDDDIVRRSIHETLQLSGYRVLEAANAKQALEMSARYDGPVHLMLTDLVMPDMSGRDLVRHIAPSRPEMQVLLISGYTHDPRTRQAIGEGMAFFGKPFTPARLVQKVRDMLSGATASLPASG